MKLGIYFAALNSMNLEEAILFCSQRGVESVELSAHTGGRFDVERMLHGEWREVLEAFSRRGLSISALNMSADSQLLLGPYHADTDWIHPGTRIEKVDFATRRMRSCVELAARMSVPVISGFVGCEDYSRWFPWPKVDAWEQMESDFQDRVLPLLDLFSKEDVKFAMECHPKQLVYNTETALRSIDLVSGHKSWGFNLDPANLMLAGVDAAVFVAELGERIFNVHAKDGEVVKHNVMRSGLLANGDWDRPDRGFRFRIPGWGDVDWKRLITELHIRGYRGPLSIEHEDATMGPVEGLTKAIDFVGPLLMTEEFPGRWW